jgi:hypothetical protein
MQPLALPRQCHTTSVSADQEGNHEFCPRNVPRSIKYNFGTEFILLSVGALDEVVYSARDMQQYGKVVRLECSWALWKE